MVTLWKEMKAVLIEGRRMNFEGREKTNNSDCGQKNDALS